jgi:hypothetical protein
MPYPYPWPIAEYNSVMSQALDIAMDYLELTGRAVLFSQVQEDAASAILSAWRGGVRHKIRLANCAINAIEKQTAVTRDLQALYPRVS